MTKLDSKIKSSAERVELVKKILEEEYPNEDYPDNIWFSKHLDNLATYICDAAEKESGSGEILTANRMSTINSRESSYEDIFAKYEDGGSDNAYHLFIEPDKNCYFSNKENITQADLERVPGLQDLADSIELAEARLDKVSGRDRYILQKQIIDLRKEQYLLRQSFDQPVSHPSNTIHAIAKIPFDEKIIINKDGSFKIDGFSLLIPEHVSALLCNYMKLKIVSEGKFENDAYYLLLELEGLIKHSNLKVLYPDQYDILVYKTQGYTNEYIQNKLLEKYGKEYSPQQISSLWRKRIPKFIATYAQKEYLLWYYTHEEKGYWKRCGRCGKIKLAHPMFFSKNSSSKDGFHSLCKDCRNNSEKLKRRIQRKQEKEKKE